MSRHGGPGYWRGKLNSFDWLPSERRSLLPDDPERGRLSRGFRYPRAAETRVESGYEEEPCCSQ